MEEEKVATVEENLQQISEYIDGTSGLQATNEGLQLQIFQKTDGKKLTLDVDSVEEVISRVDSVNQAFLQVNFLDGRKLLLTEKLIGFKPAETRNLDMSKLPRVVTTPDLLSVVEAIEETMEAEDAIIEEINVLKKVFDSVLRGGEAIGFDLGSERTWLKMLVNTNIKPSA